MAGELAVIEREIDRYQVDIMRIASEAKTSFAYEPEREFAVQQLMKNSYSLGIAVKRPDSVCNALRSLAGIGLSLNPARKQAYLVPRDGEIKLDISYMGLVDIALDSGAILWAKAAVVCANDSFKLMGLDKQPNHQFEPFASPDDRGNIVGVYVCVKTPEGDYLTETMAVEDVNAIRDRSSSWQAFKSGKAKSSPWSTDYGEMAKKTVVKRAVKMWPSRERVSQAIHYLNTEGNEGLADLSNQQPTHPQVMTDVEEIIAAAKACKSIDTLRAAWQEAAEVCRKNKDRKSYDLIKDAVEKRLAQLQKGDDNGNGN